MQDKVIYSQTGAGIEEGCNMIPSSIASLSEKQKAEWKEVFDKLLIIDDNNSDEIDIKKLVNLILSLNDSTISYWWRGGMLLGR